MTDAFADAHPNPCTMTGAAFSRTALNHTQPMLFAQTPLKLACRLILQAMGLLFGGTMLLAQLPPQASVGFLTNRLEVQETDGAISVFLYRDGNPNGTNRVRVTSTLGNGVQSPMTLEFTEISFLPGTNLVELALMEADGSLAPTGDSLDVANVT